MLLIPYPTTSMILMGYYFSYVFLIAGRLPKNNNVSWRGDSCLKDELPGGYYMILSIFGHGSSSSWAQIQNTFSRPLVPQQIPQTRLLHLLMEQMVGSPGGKIETCSWAIDYNWPALICATCRALTTETAAAIIVFEDSMEYSKKFFHRPSSPSYSSTCYWDEFWWSGPWLYSATVPILCLLQILF